MGGSTADVDDVEKTTQNREQLNHEALAKPGHTVACP